MEDLVLTVAVTAVLLGIAGGLLARQYAAVSAWRSDSGLAASSVDLRVARCQLGVNVATLGVGWVAGPPLTEALAAQAMALGSGPGLAFTAAAAAVLGGLTGARLVLGERLADRLWMRRNERSRQHHRDARAGAPIVPRSNTLHLRESLPVGLVVDRMVATHATNALVVNDEGEVRASVYLGWGIESEGSRLEAD